LRQDVCAFVVDEVHLLDTELANLLLAKILALASSRSSGTSRTAAGSAFASRPPVPSARPAMSTARRTRRRGGNGVVGAGRPLYTRTERDIPVRLLLGPGARWVTEYYETEDVHRREDGSVEATLPAKDLPWLAKLVLRLGGEAAVRDPPELAEMVRRTAQETLARYRSKG